MEEVWVAVAGYEGLYEISNMGQIKSLSRKSRCDRWGCVRYRIVRERILKYYISIGGYKMVRLSNAGAIKGHGIARLMALSFLPNPENKTTVNHLDGIKTHDFLWNLEWATHAENMRHARKMGLVKSMKGVKKSPEHIKNMSLSRIGHVKSEATREKLSIAHQGEKNHFWGKHHTQETIDILRLKSSRRIHTQETKDKIRNAITGKKRSEETLAKMRISSQKRWAKVREQRLAGSLL